TRSIAPSTIARTSSRSRVEVISDEICWMIRTSFDFLARSRFSRSIVSWFSAIFSRRPDAAEPSGPDSVFDILRDGEDAVDVGGAELEDPLQADHRGDRLDLHVHGVENGTLGLGEIVLHLQVPAGQRFGAHHP